MRKLCIALLLAFASFIVGCCPSSVETSEERCRRLRDIADLQGRMAVDDVDFFLLQDRNTYLTQWHPRVGH